MSLDVNTDLIPLPSSELAIKIKLIITVKWGYMEAIS